MSATTHLNRDTLVARVAQHMHDEIARGVYQAGERLPSERERCEQWGVSRTVLREAQRELVRSGHLEIRPGRGTYVRSRSDMRDHALSQWLSNHGDYIAKLLDMRALLEPGIAQLAATRADEQGCAELQELVDALRDSTDLEEAVEADEGFHLALARMTGNSMVVQLVQHTMDAMGGERDVTLSSPSGIAAAALGHQRVLDAIRRRDATGAWQAMMHHLDDARSYAQRSASAQPSVPVGRRAATRPKKGLAPSLDKA